MTAKTSLEDDLKHTAEKNTSDQDKGITNEQMETESVCSKCSRSSSLGTSSDGERNTDTSKERTLESAPPTPEKKKNGPAGPSLAATSLRIKHRSKTKRARKHERECTGLKRRLEESEYNAPPEKKQKLTDEELIEYELANIPDAMHKEYSGPLLGDDVRQEVLLGDDVRQEVLQDDDVRQEGDGEVEEDCALYGNVSLLKFQPNKREKFDLQLTLEGKKKNIIKQLKTQRQRHRGIKWFLCVKVRMIKTSPDGDVDSTPHFRTKHPVPWGSHPHRVNHYKPYESELNMAGIDYPVKIDQVKKFERQNPTISVSVFGYEENELFPLYVTKDKKELHVNLLLYSQDTRRHYCLIRDLDRLLSSITRHDGRMYHCNYCMHGFVGQDLLDDHEPHCGRHRPQKIKLPDEDHTTLQYTEALPVNNFGWLTEQEATELQQDLMTLPDDGTEGYILEVDLSYPEELHDLHNDYPLAPERQKVTHDMLSPYCQQLNEELNLGGAPVAKLVPNLNDKQHYILHYRNLKQYLSLGMKLTKVHRVLGFDQSPWLKSYINFNTESENTLLMILKRISSN
ncbi:hypothetical protein QZH41_017840 [Actinostola sp. cb2023]|nr:hypothetical protein QZH41_017840 [Actinostola sp. cb2023]